MRQCLERTIVAEPEYSEAFACLSLVYSNARRFAHPHAGAVDVEGARALALARQAVALAPGSSWAQYALALAYWFAGDVGRGLEALETGRALNPNDTTIIADLGQRYAMLADWDRAVPLLDEAFERNPAQPGTYRIGMFLYHYAHGRFEEALAEARAVGAAHVVYGWIAIAGAAARLGRTEEAAAAVDAHPRDRPAVRRARRRRTCRRATSSRGCCGRSSMACGWPGLPGLEAGGRGDASQGPARRSGDAARPRRLRAAGALTVNYTSRRDRSRPPVVALADCKPGGRRHEALAGHPPSRLPCSSPRRSWRRSSSTTAPPRS